MRIGELLVCNWIRTAEIEIVEGGEVIIHGFMGYGLGGVDFPRLGLDFDFYSFPFAFIDIHESGFCRYSALFLRGKDDNTSYEGQQEMGFKKTYLKLTDDLDSKPKKSGDEIFENIADERLLWE
ncbi:hypothetical protein Tco_1144415 [Tanacetum coccineum]